jgi:hypothetical protein
VQCTSGSTGWPQDFTDNTHLPNSEYKKEVNRKVCVCTRCMAGVGWGGGEGWVGGGGGGGGGGEEGEGVPRTTAAASGSHRAIGGRVPSQASALPFSASAPPFLATAALFLFFAVPSSFCAPFSPSSAPLQPLFALQPLCPARHGCMRIKSLSRHLQ